MIEITPLRENDRQAWQPLATGYNAFYERVLPDAAYDRTWHRLMQGDAMHGLAARLDGRLVGRSSRTAADVAVAVDDGAGTARLRASCHSNAALFICFPTMWLDAMGLQASARQEFPELVVHTPHGTSRYDLPWTFSTFDYRTLCEILQSQADAQFETAKVVGRADTNVPPASSASRPGAAGSAPGRLTT